MKRPYVTLLCILFAIPIFFFTIIILQKTFLHACPIFTRSTAITVPDYPGSNLQVLTDEHTNTYQLRRTQFTTVDSPSIVTTFYDKHLSGLDTEKSASDDRFNLTYSDFSQIPFVTFMVDMKYVDKRLSVSTELWVRPCTRE